MKRLSLIRRATLTAVTLFTLLGMHASSAPAQEGGGGGEGGFWECATACSRGWHRASWPSPYPNGFPRSERSASTEKVVSGSRVP